MRATEDSDRRLFTGEVKQSSVEIKQTENLVRDNCIMIKVVISGLSFQKKVSSSIIATAEESREAPDLGEDEIGQTKEFDSSLFKVTKSLISKEHLKPLSSLDSNFRETILSLGFRPVFIDSGFTLIPNTRVREAEEKIEQFKRNRDSLVEQLIKKYKVAKFRAMGSLGSHYCEADYPSEAEIKCRFTVSHQYFSTQAPRDLEEIDREAFLENQRRADEMWKSASAEVEQILAAQMSELADSLLDKVKDNGDGSTRKQYKQGFVTKLNDFLETFDLKNITNNEELNKQVKKMRDVLAGRTPDEIKNREDVRIKIENVVREIKSDLDIMVTDAPIRKIRF